MAKKTSEKKEEALEISVQESESPLVEQQNIENRQLRNILLVLGGALIMIILFIFVINSIRHFELENVEWKVVREKNLIFYNTAIPLYSQVGRGTGSYLVDYNFYIRNDPRKLYEEIPFKGKFFLMKDVVFDSEGSDDFKCDGDEVIAIANLVSLFERMGATVIKNESASCGDAKGKYTFIRLRKSETTEVRQTGVTCYDINTNNCEILKSTERFMLEGFIEINKAENKN